jgi:hypothetical protein
MEGGKVGRGVAEEESGQERMEEGREGGSGGEVRKGRKGNEGDKKRERMKEGRKVGKEGGRKGTPAYLHVDLLEKGEDGDDVMPFGVPGRAEGPNVQLARLRREGGREGGRDGWPGENQAN